MTIEKKLIHRRTLIKKLSQASLGATFLQLFGLGVLPARAQTQFVLPILAISGLEKIVAPMFQGVNNGIRTFFDKTGETVGSFWFVSYVARRKWGFSDRSSPGSMAPF